FLRISFDIQLHCDLIASVLSAKPSAACLSLKSFLFGPGNPRHLHSFPTRRSSDLIPKLRISNTYKELIAGGRLSRKEKEYIHERSEEHTSELQSRENLVCRLLLEKKNRMRQQHEQIPYRMCFDGPTFRTHFQAKNS